MKYQSELIKEILEQRGHEKSSLHYESECVEEWIEEYKWAYPKLCDYKGEWLNYIVENPIGKFPYETITGVSEATINNAVPFAYKSAILKGQTLDSLIDFKDSFSVNNNVIDFDFLFKNKIDLTYTLVINITEATSRLGASDYIEVRGIREDNTVVNIKRLTQEFAVGTYSIDFTFNEVFSGLRLAVSFNCVANAKLKGELYSVKLPVLKTTGKNLFNSEWEIGGLSFTDGTPTNSQNSIKTKGFSLIPSNIELTISKDSNYYGQIFWYDENFNFISRRPIGDIKNTITSPTNAKYAKMYFDTTNTDVKVQIEEGSAATSYEPYKSIILTVNEDVTLRSNGSVCDELDLLTSKLTQRIDEEGEILVQEVVKTVDLNITNQDGQTLSKIKPIEGTMHVQTDGQPIKPFLEMEVPVEATTQNLASFIEMEE